MKVYHAETSFRTGKDNKMRQLGPSVFTDWMCKYPAELGCKFLAVSLARLRSSLGRSGRCHRGKDQRSLAKRTKTGHLQRNLARCKRDGTLKRPQVRDLVEERCHPHSATIARNVSGNDA